MARRPSEQEYRRRWAAIEAGFAEYKVDAVAVTAPPTVAWLTGAIAGSLWVSPAIVTAGNAPTFVVRRYDEDRIRAESPFSTLISYFGDDAVEVWATTLEQAGLGAARLGLELDFRGLTPGELARLQARLPRLRIVNVSALTRAAREVKSDEEIALFREVARLNRIGFQALVDALRPGITGLEVYQAMQRALVDAGSDAPHIEILLGGSTALPHAEQEPSVRLRPGDVAFTEFSGELAHYSTGLVRSALFGRNPAAEALYRVAQETLDAIEVTLRPGVTTGEIDAAARVVINRHGRGETLRHRTGYAIDILWGPLGTAPGATSFEPGGAAIVREGMVFHTPINLFERGQFGVGCSDTWLVTACGCEPLSGLPRDLTIVG